MFELEKAISAFENNETTGIDDLQPELFKHGGGVGKVALKELTQRIWSERKIPEQGKTAIIVTFFEKGDTTKCANYRGISLLPIALEICEPVLLQRITNAYESAARQNQAGSRTKRGCRDHIFALRRTLEQRYEYSRHIYSTFIDFKVAFDSVCKEVIWKISRNLGMPDKILSIFKAMYKDTQPNRNK